MFTAMRRLAVAVVVLAGSMFFASSAHATFKLNVNGTDMATGDASGNISYGVNTSSINYFITAQSVATSQTSHLIQTFTMSFTNISNAPVTYVFKLTEDNALSSIAGSVTGTFKGQGLFSSSTAPPGQQGSVTATGTVKGTGNPSMTQTIFTSPNFVYANNNTLAGNFSAGYTGNTPLTLCTTLTVTVPASSSFTYSGSVSFSVPEPATVAMLASGVPVLGAMGWMRRKRNAKKVSA